MQITFTISEEKVSRIINAMGGLFPIPLDEKGNPLFTESQWAKEKLRRLIIDLVHRYESRKAQNEARALIEKDDSLVS